MEKQTAIRITDDMSHLQFLLNTIGEQRDRALKAEAELRRFYKNLGQLTVEHIDLKSMLADAGVRVEVLQKRLDKLVAILNERRIGCPPGREESSKWCDLFLCDECWKDWLEQEVQA